MKLRRSPAPVPSQAPHPVDLPRVNMLVRLLRPEQEAGSEPAPDDELPSRVEDVASGGGPVRFRVPAPAYRGDLVDGDTEAVWLLTWATERGRWELPVRRWADGEEVAPADGPRSWWLVPAGPLRRNQRRSFFRVQYGTRVGVDVLADPWSTLVGRTLDVSEGGVRCLLPAESLLVGTPVLVRLGLDGLDAPFAGVVHRSTRPPRAARVAGWHREVVLAFDDPDAQGDALRNVLARLQLTAMRTRT